jgi:hypothetical protein
MSWLFSQALVEEYLPPNCLDGEQSVQSSGKPTQQAYCAPDKMTVFSRLSRFGMTYKPLMEHHGEELLKSYLAAFHVPTSVSQDAVQDLMESTPPCGITWRGWLAKFDPDMYLWKTAQCSFIEDSDESLATFPASGMTRGGLLWERQMSEHRINATASGLWRTPDTGGGKRPAQAGQESSRERSTYPDQIGGPSEQSETLANTSAADVQRQRKSIGIRQERDTPRGTGWWSTEPAVGRVADGVAARVDRLKAIGNGQVPLCAATAWRILTER